MDVDLPPLPSEFMPSSMFGKDESTTGMLTSTVRKPTDTRVSKFLYFNLIFNCFPPIKTPLGEIDLNRQKEKGKKRPLSGVEDTFQAIQRIAEETEMEQQYEHGAELSHLGETMLQPIGGRELFDITGIIEHPPAVTTAEQPEVTILAPEITEVQAEKRKEASVLMRPAKKVKLALKKKLIIDEIKEIPDKEMERRLKHRLVVQPSDIERVTIFNKLPFVDLFHTNNRDMRRRKFLKVILTLEYSFVLVF